MTRETSRITEPKKTKTRAFHISHTRREGSSGSELQFEEPNRVRRRHVPEIGYFLNGNADRLEGGDGRSGGGSSSHLRRGARKMEVEKKTRKPENRDGGNQTAERVGGGSVSV